jgi:cysteine desulfurase
MDGAKSQEKLIYFMSKEAVYLDYNATTPVDPRVLKAILPYFNQHFGNPSSALHQHGWIAQAAVSKAREEVAALINTHTDEIIFTSGATESIHLAIQGLYDIHKNQRNHIVTLKSEHAAVLETCKNLEKQGAMISYLPVDREGRLDPETLEKAITHQTLLVCIMYANNETGVLQDIPRLSKIAHDKNAFFMSDATQAMGKVRVDVAEDGIDLLSISAHKMYGPKGIGALYIRRTNPRVKINAQLLGGQQEHALRAGTLNVPGIVGLGAACALAENEMWDDNMRISKLRTRLEQGLLDLGGISVNGSQKFRLPNVSNLSFQGIKAGSLITALPLLSFSTGSACHSAISKPSHVLEAMGLPADLCFNALRFSLGKYTTEAEITFTLESIRNVIEKIRA